MLTKENLEPLVRSWYFTTMVEICFSHRHKMICSSDENYFNDINSFNVEEFNNNQINLRVQYILDNINEIIEVYDDDIFLSSVLMIDSEDLEEHDNNIIGVYDELALPIMKELRNDDVEYYKKKIMGLIENIKYL